jgi:hypothetical protein
MRVIILTNFMDKDNLVHILFGTPYVQLIMN